MFKFSNRIQTNDCQQLFNLVHEWSQRLLFCSGTVMASSAWLMPAVVLGSEYISSSAAILQALRGSASGISVLCTRTGPCWPVFQFKVQNTDSRDTLD